jgi:hypothetical protein
MRIAHEDSFLYRMLPRQIRKNYEDKTKTKEILDYYKNSSDATHDKELIEALDHLKMYGFNVFPHPFREKYKTGDIEVFSDDNNGLKYVLTDGKRLYFKRSSSIRSIKRAYRNLLMEQDALSPHRYLTDNFNIEKGDVLVDVGAAEGNLPLSVIERVAKVFMFETDPDWIEALEATFAPWKDKIEIINKFVSDRDDATNISLDCFRSDFGNFTFLKVDAEGSDEWVLNGCLDVLSSRDKLKIALCCYHRPQDFIQFEELLTKFGFQTEFAPNYMVYPNDESFSPPYLRRGVLRGIRS